jgi:hypothetical protein
MRRLVLLTLALSLAACATRPQQQPVAEVPQPERVSPQARSLIGLTPNDLVGHFGHPALQISEGTSMKLQFRGRSCVLDAYLYPSTGGQLRVTHVDTRALSGVDTDQAACIFALENPS